MFCAGGLGVCSCITNSIKNLFIISEVIYDPGSMYMYIFSMIS